MMYAMGFGYWTSKVFQQNNNSVSYPFETLESSALDKMVLDGKSLVSVCKLTKVNDPK